MANLNFVYKILEEAGIPLEEVGDFQNLEKFKSYDMHKFEDTYATMFNTEHGPLGVYFIKFTKEELEKDFKACNNETANGYNVVYELNDSDRQATRTDYRYLLRVLATVTEKVVEFCKSIKPDFIFIYGNAKFGETTSSETKKAKLYREVIEKNISRVPGYSVAVHSVNGNKGFLISK